MKVNINEYVKVKLTEEGFAILHQQHKDFWESVGKSGRPYIEPKVDAEGYSEFQFWNLMSEFGSHMRLGRLSPFEGGMIVFGDDV